MLERRLATALSDDERAHASFELGLFHDNNGRELMAIPYYEAALERRIRRSP